ncbi:HlyD family efflux transporter periplasmic adaptor subunit [Leptolyngbya sp. FACHB-321]|uniref:HlyD family efflux transporter periplasmic adaptor subunit n=1 Tax=Leptolyngbya sp. FACHB-321 TaxID=2692807 RepID=UPI0016878854|nr:HlyD family efflux transporter periplasmic adaptor subunit [Leptolyngbya sp. FACHB-321]
MIVNRQQLGQPNHRWRLGLMVGGVLVTGSIAYYNMKQFHQASTPEPTQITSAQTITALGRLEPAQEVVNVSVPAALHNDRIAQLLVKRGDRVKAGQVMAVMDARERLQKILLEAQEQVSVAQAKLAQVRAGAKAGEIAAQQAQVVRFQSELQGEIATKQAEITRRRSEVRNARAEYDRYQFLQQQGAIAASQFDQKRLTLETAQAQLTETQSNQTLRADSLQAQLRAAQATLRQVAEVRPTDVLTAQAEVNQAIAAAKRAAVELKHASIRAPSTGQILEIYAKPGEVVGDNGIVALGQTDQMEVVAEVYQSDISNVWRGQVASVTGESFAGELRGTVREVGLQVSKQEVNSNQPGENLDQRVVKVRIRLNPADSKRVAGLTNLQVQAAMQL